MNKQQLGAVDYTVIAAFVFIGVVFGLILSHYVPAPAPAPVPVAPVSTPVIPVLVPALVQVAVVVAQPVVKTVVWPQSVVVKPVIVRNVQTISQRKPIVALAVVQKLMVKQQVVKAAAVKKQAVPVVKTVKSVAVVVKQITARPDSQLVRFLYSRAQVYSKTRQLKSSSWKIVRVQQNGNIHDAIRSVGGDTVETFRFYVRNGLSVSQWQTVAVYCGE